MSRWLCRIVPILAVVVLASVAAGARQDEPKRVALLVGVDQYTARILADKPLRFAERDAIELGAVLKAQNYDQVVVLTGRAATREGIDTALKAILKGRAATDVVVIGFSGHGVQMPLVDDRGRLVRDERGNDLSEAYFCPADAVLGRPDTMVSLTRLMERLNREGGINLMLTDACRDDPEEAGKKGLRTLSGDELVGRMPRNSVMLFSCSAGQRALETDQAGGGHGVFFHLAIEALKGRAADPETGEVTWDDLVTYLRKNVNRKAREWDPESARKVDASPRTRGNLQNPHMVGNLIATPVLARADVSRRMPAEAMPVPRPAVTSDITNSIGMTLTLIKADDFMMGSDATDPDASDDEFVDKAAGKKTKHRVRITRPFYLGVNEVTRGQFRRFVDDAGYQTEAEKDGKGSYGWNEEKKTFEQDPKYTWRNAGFDQTDEHPVVNVSWNDAVAFAQWLSRKEGKTYRLPTEAEWEYACRAGSTTRFSNGDDTEVLAAVGNVADATARGKYPDWTSTIAARDGYVYTAPAGRFQPNKFGLYDMHGNVYEWCSDGYAADYYKHSPVDDPPGALGASYRVIRGGSWRDYPRYCRSADRDWNAPVFRFIYLGFRLALVQSVR